MNKLFTFLALCFFNIALFSQERVIKCIDFEQLSLDSFYGERTGYTDGTIFLEEDEIVGTLSNFLYSNGTTEFYGATVQK